MMHFLQERGLFAFVTRFVDHERIPIPTLLLAFNVLLVRRVPVPFSNIAILS